MPLGTDEDITRAGYLTAATRLSIGRKERFCHFGAARSTPLSCLGVKFDQASTFKA
jgi:hypothetical protein